MSHPSINKPLILSLWRVYSGDASELPTPFLSVLIYKGGEEGAFIGVFSGYPNDFFLVFLDSWAGPYR